MVKKEIPADLKPIVEGHSKSRHRKSKKKREKSVPPPPEPPPEDPRFRLPKHLKEWVILRSKPKVLAIRRKKRKLTRFQKRGPVNLPAFKKWYKKQMSLLLKTFNKSVKLAEKLKKQKLKRHIRKENIVYEINWDRLEELAAPRIVTEKYDIPLEEDYPFNPKIHLKKPAKKEKHRPILQKQIPAAFMHQILEWDFWYEYRFPIRESALKYKAKENILRLAMPRKYPPDPHCDIPAKQEDIPPRQKMPKPRWTKHIEYLKYFASPKSKMFPRQKIYPSRGNKVCISDLEPLLNRLATPKKYNIQKDRDPYYISKSTLNAKPSKATQRLATPKKRAEGQFIRKDPYKISEKAKTANASERVVLLAAPKKHPTVPEKAPWSLKPNKSGMSHLSYICPEREYSCKL